MGLDHPLVQEESGRWRSVPPEDIGIAVSGDVDEPVLLSLWIVETSVGNGERRVVVQPIAVRSKMEPGSRAVDARAKSIYKCRGDTGPSSQSRELSCSPKLSSQLLQRKLKIKGPRMVTAAIRRSLLDMSRSWTGEL